MRLHYRTRLSPLTVRAFRDRSFVPRSHIPCVAVTRISGIAQGCDLGLTLGNKHVTPNGVGLRVV